MGLSLFPSLFIQAVLIPRNFSLGGWNYLGISESIHTILQIKIASEKANTKIPSRKKQSLKKLS